MSVTLGTALLVQLSTILLLRRRLGKTWLRRPVTLLVLASVAYQGVSPVLLSFPSVGKWDLFRHGVQQSYVDEATLIMSAGVLAFTLCYLLMKPERVAVAPAVGEVEVAARTLDWQLLIMACIPLAVLTYEGRGYNGTVGTAPGAAVGSELASAFFVLLVALAAFSLVLGKGPRWFLPILAAQSLLLAAAGERSPVLMDAIVLIVLLARAGRRPSGRQVAVAVGVALAAVLAITGVRAEHGRSIYYRDSGLSTRLSALASGLTGAGTTSAGQPGLVAQAATRLDAVDFAGAILQAEHSGQPRLSAADVPESLLIAVPSSLWPSKLDHAKALSVVDTETEDFGLQPVNFLPGLAGMYFGVLTLTWLIALLAALGLAAGWAERLLLRSWGAGRTVLLAGAIIGALGYEQGLPGMLLALRSAAVIAVAVKLVAVARKRRPDLGGNWVGGSAEGPDPTHMTRV